MAIKLNYAVMMKGKDVDQLIALAAASLKTMRDRVQVAAVAILMHAEKHGDYSKANVLIDQLGNGINKASLQKFFVDFGGLVLDEESGQFIGWHGKEHIKASFEDAKHTAWYELKQAPNYKGFDLTQAIVKLIKDANKAKKEAANDEAKAELVKVDDAKLAALAAILENKVA